MAGTSGQTQLPVSAADVEEAERQLGFPLHPLLTALYRQVGNGGFGPMDAILPLTIVPDHPDGESAVQGYLDRIPPADAETWWAWPEGVLPILDWGCGMYACIDCQSEDGAVLLFEPNAISNQDVSAAWFVDAGSLAEWLETWLSGEGWYEENAMDGGFDMQPWAEATSRLQRES
ncbi:SMI1/KNR4 family protein [Streptomyces sp. NPDC001205]